MSNLYAASKYKQNIINALYKSPDFIKLMNPPEPCHPDLDVYDVLSGGEWVFDGVKYTEQGQVFDYNFVDDTTNAEKTFVFVENDITDITDNTYVDFNLYICVFTIKRLVRLTTQSIPTAKEVMDMGYFATPTRGNRVDALCDCIDRLLNGTGKLAGIGTVSPAYRDHVTIYQPNYKYYGKCLKYTITNWNPGDESCGV